MPPFASILVLLIFVAVIALLISVSVRAVRIHSAKSWPTSAASARTDLPRCGQCGYATIGLTTFQCPECGGDLRQVGIIPPGSRGFGGPMPRIIGWTIIVLALAIPSTILLVNTVVPTVIRANGQTTFTSSESGVFQSVVLVWNVRQMDWPFVNDPSRPVGCCRITITLSEGVVSTATADSLSGVYTIDKPASAKMQSQTDFDLQALENWMAGLGVDVSDPEVQAEMAEIVSTVATHAPSAASVYGGGTFAYRSSFGGGLGFRGSGTSSSGSSGPLEWPTALIALLWVILWVVGVVRIVRRGRVKGS